jgi:hypothetical protein
MLKRELKNLNLVQILIIVLLLIVLLQRCDGGKHISDPAEPKIIRDTVWVNNTGSTITKPVVTNNIPYSVPIDRWNTEYLPDTNYTKLLKQYEEIVRKLLSTNVQKDSVKIDSIGHVYITDSVMSNMIKNRNVTWNLKYPIITNTIIVPEPKKTQWYIGGSIQGEQEELIDQINAGLLIKNKKDQIYGGYIGINTNGNLQIGVQSYWKIKLHK